MQRKGCRFRLRPRPEMTKFVKSQREAARDIAASCDWPLCGSRFQPDRVLSQRQRTWLRNYLRSTLYSITRLCRGVASQTFTVSSQLADASRCPSGLDVTLFHGAADGIVDSLPDTGSGPLTKITAHRLPFRNITPQSAPRKSLLVDVTNRVHNFAIGMYESFPNFDAAATGDERAPTRHP